MRVRAAKTPAGAGVDKVLLDGYVNGRYREFLDKYPWSRLIKTGALNTVAVYETGTISIENGATSGTGNGTAFTSAMTGRRIRPAGRNEMYIFTHVSLTDFTIDRAYEGDDIEGGGYKIFQNIYALPSDLDALESIKAPGAKDDLDQIERETLDRLSPDREQVDRPRMYAPYDDENDSSPLPQVELYPIPRLAEGLTIRYKRTVARLTAPTESFLPWVNEECIFAGVEADLKKLGGDLVGYKADEIRFNSLLQDAIRLETTRDVPTQMVMASRFTRHRRARAYGNDGDDLRNWLRRSD